MDKVVKNPTIKTVNDGFFGIGEFVWNKGEQFITRTAETEKGKQAMSKIEYKPPEPNATSTQQQQQQAPPPPPPHQPPEEKKE